MRSVRHALLSTRAEGRLTGEKGLGTFFDAHEPHLHCYDYGADVEIKYSSPTWGRTLAFNLKEMLT